MSLLLEARREALPIYVVITMRSEYLGACTLLEALPEAINQGLFLTPRMTREECRQAIVGPAGVCGIRYRAAAGQPPPQRSRRLRAMGSSGRLPASRTASADAPINCR